MDAAKPEIQRPNHLDAARQITYIARTASSWAGELLTLPELAHAPWPRANAERFAVEIETKIGFLIERSPSRREATAPPAADADRVRIADADAKWLTRWLGDQKECGHCGEGNVERRERAIWNDRIERILAALKSTSADAGAT